MTIAIEPLTPARWADFEAVFTARGCSIARGCWCMAYRESGRTQADPGCSIADSRKRRMRALVDAGPPPGLLAYVDGQPAGWVTLGPRGDFARLLRSPVMKPVDAQPVWSVVCFVVPKAWRGRGIAHALLHGAAAYARERGAIWLEAYPVDKPQRGADDWLWHGPLSMYVKAGFEEVARRKPTRPVVRLALR